MQNSAFKKKVDKRIWRAVALVLPIVVAAILLSRSVTARTTYVITDGDQVITHSSYSTDPAAVLDEAGLQLSDLDLYTTQETGGISEITVQRSKAVTIHYGKDVIRTSSYDETVAKLLQRIGLNYESADALSVSPDTITYDGMEIHLDWHLSDSQKYTAEIPFEVSYVEDPSMKAGEEKIIAEGQVGQKICTATVSYVNGKETGRKVIKEEVITEPVDQIVAIGTGEGEGKPADKVLIGDGYIVLPTGEVLTYTHSDEYKATAYTSWIEDITGTTYTGTLARVGAIAVDPRYIPYGTRMFIVSNDGEYVYGIATAEDCGGGVRGKHVDLFLDTVSECFQFGVRKCTIYFLGDADQRGPQNK